MTRLNRDALIGIYQQTWEEFQSVERAGDRRFRDVLADRILAEIEPFPELRVIAENERAVDLGMRCFMRGHEQKLDAIARLCDQVIARTGLAPDLVREIRAVIDGAAS